MARVDYFALEEEIRRVLKTDAALADAHVLLEEELLSLGAETTPCIVVYLEGRDAPPELQRLAAGKQTRFLVRFSIWCWHYSLESLAKASELRDDLMGKVELALMGNRTLNSKVETSWLEGGEFQTAKATGGNDFLSGGEVLLVADVKASTA